MNPRDLPDVGAELIIEMHEVRSELKAINGRLDRLEGTMEQVVQEQRGMRQDMQGMRQDMQALPGQIGTATIRALEPFGTRLLEHDTQLRKHDGRLNNLEFPQQ
jgi:chromosome segregation ATPase